MNQLEAEVLKKHGTETAYHLGIFDSYNEGRVTFRQPFRNVVAVEVFESYLPYVDYTIDDFRRTLWVDDQIINLSVGDYTIDELIDELNVKLPINASVSQRTKIITFTTRVRPGGSFTLKIGKELGKVLGLREGAFDSDSGTFFDSDSGTLVGHHPYNLHPDTVVRLMCDEVDNSVTKGRPGSNVIALTEQLLRHNLVKEDVHIPMRRDFHPISSLGQMTISFVRSDSRELYDFKGQEWYVKLVVHSIDVEDGKHAQNALVRAPVSRPNMLPYASNHEW